jgi:heme exporter protein C
LNVPAAPGRSLTAGIFFSLVAVWAYFVWNAPLDSVQGVIQKILYVHPPLAFGAYLGFFCTAVFGALYLWKGDDRWDRWSLSSAEVGVLLCTLMLLTGPIWAKGTWGKWWSWDTRLTITLLQYLVYLAYLLLRGFTEGSERTARFGAVYAIAGVVMIPLNYFAIDMAAGRAIHPENLGDGSLGDGMGMPFLLGTLVVLSAFAYLVVRRYEVACLRDEAARREVEAAGSEGAWAT